MLLKTEGKKIILKTDQYKLSFAEDAPYVLLEGFKGERLAELFYLSSVHSTDGKDDTVKIATWQVEELQDRLILTLEAASSIWNKKIYRFICEEERFAYDIEVFGNTALTDINYFGGYYSADLKWGSGFFYSAHNFSQVFNPEPNTLEENYLPVSAGTVIDLMGVNLPAKGDWFFTPPPFCFAFKGKNNWFSMGIEAKAGANRFTEYSYHGQLEGFHLSLSYEGYTKVEDSYLLPAIAFDFGEDEYAVLEAHVHSLERYTYFKSVEEREKAAWWYQPISCGWGSQCYLAARDKGYAPDYARQELYENFIAILKDQGMNPGIIVIDDKWQKHYGENQVDQDKWPDLRGFIEQQHQEGRKVLLWLKAWDPEGIPAEECICNAAGIPVAVDPSNPAFAMRLRKSIRNMLSPEGYNADGFKIDFTARIPSGPGMKIYEDIWGLELMKLYLKIIYDEAKKSKNDALIMTHTAHPYLADVLDMIRLNDINIGTDVNKAMIHRARVARIACPEAIVDTDNWPITDKETWREYVKLQPELGVPSFYFSSHIDSTQEPLMEEDYQLLRNSWQKYLDKLAIKNLGG